MTGRAAGADCGHAPRALPTAFLLQNPNAALPVALVPHKKRTLDAEMPKHRRLAQKRLPLPLVASHGHSLPQHIHARKVCLARPRHTKEGDAARGGTE